MYDMSMTLYSGVDIVQRCTLDRIVSIRSQLHCSRSHGITATLHCVAAGTRLRRSVKGVFYHGVQS